MLLSLMLVLFVELTVLEISLYGKMVLVIALSKSMETFTYHC